MSIAVWEYPAEIAAPCSRGIRIVSASDDCVFLRGSPLLTAGLALTSVTTLAYTFEDEGTLVEEQNLALYLYV